jgi:hypothetical protein
MNYILILVMTTSSGITSQSIRFNSQPACLQAMSRVIDDMEKHLKIKAVCVQESL